MAEIQPTLEQIVSLAKRRGFVYPTSEIYGGLTSSYDYGPMGALLLKNIKDIWWQKFILDRDDMYALDSQILLHPQTWVASGHVNSFTDPLVEDKITHQRYRADHIIKNWLKNQNIKELESLNINDLSTLEMGQVIEQYHITSPEGNELTQPKDFNILFETAIGAVAGEKSLVYMRGETAQGIFSNFKQVLNSTRARLPFGIGQIGKSFRNEITSGQFLFRQLEFEQAEIEYFFDPATEDWQTLMNQWREQMMGFVVDDLGIKADNLRWRRHSDQERSHYSLETFDLDYQFPFGWDELWGIAYRTDYDLKQHMQYSGESLAYIDPQTHQKIIPHVIEPAAGIDRFFLMILVDAYRQDAEGRFYLDLKPSLAPYQVAVFPLLKNKPELVDLAKSVYTQLKYNFHATFDERGNIGKRYLSQDEIGTPYCITVDFASLEDKAVTVRERNSTQQERIAIDQLDQYLSKMIKLASK
jgi:glycyl-tRNA synthetase